MFFFSLETVCNVVRAFFDKEKYFNSFHEYSVARAWTHFKVISYLHFTVHDYIKLVDAAFVSKLILLRRSKSKRR